MGFFGTLFCVFIGCALWELTKFGYRKYWGFIKWGFDEFTHNKKWK